MGPKLKFFYKYLRIGNKIRDMLEHMRLGFRLRWSRFRYPTQKQQQSPVPWYGALMLLDENSCCIFSGGFLNTQKINCKIITIL